MPQRFAIVFEAQDHPVPVEVRLRMLLKLMLRRFGFRVVEQVREV